MEFKNIDQKNIGVYINLTQAYESEFSALTGEVPGADGLFAVQTWPEGEYTGWLMYEEGIPVGFMVVHLGEVQDVAEFYIVPSRRCRGYGRLLASHVFACYPGQWQVRQIAGAEQAKMFWRKTIHDITGGKFYEDEAQDSCWGVVTRQRFSNQCNDEAAWEQVV